MADSTRVLHVDDDTSFAELTKSFLERENERFVIETASSADEGLERLTDCPPDCVVSDYNMPGMDGIEFLRAVREEFPDLPFILYTGKGSEAVASEAIAADVTNYLQKESGTEHYELLANRILNAVRARREAKRAERQEDLMRLTEFAGGTGGFETDLETGEILLTDGAERILDPEEGAPLTFESGFEWIHPADQEEMRRAIDRAVQADEQTSGTWRFQPREGEEKLLEWTFSTALSNGDGKKLRAAINDVTDRRERQHDLEQIETLFEHTHDTLFLVDVDEQFSLTRVSPAIEDATGVSPTELHGQTPRELFGDRQGAAIEARYRECIERRELVEYEEQLTFGERETHWETKIAPVVLGGTVEYIAGSTREVTEQHRRKRDLRLLQHAIDEANVSITLADPAQEDEPLVYVNEAFEEMTGYPPAETLGQNCRFLQGTETDPETVARLREAIDAEEPVTVELRNYRTDGTEFWNRLTVTPIYDEDGELVRYLGTQEDITAEKEGQKLLQRVTAQYETLVENYPDGAVYLIDSELECIRAGGQELRRVGLSPDEVVATTRHDLFPADIADELDHYYQEALNGNANTFEQEYDGGRYRIQTVPIRGEGEGHEYVMAVAQNITERIEDRENLERQNERLAEFASIVSHDLRNPLTVAEGQLELAEERSESEHLPTAKAAIERSQELVDELLTLAREGEELDETEPVALLEVAERSWQTVETPQATLEGGGPARIHADRSRLQQLFENLYRNAVEHGGEEVTVSVGELADGFYVADTGHGIPEGDREGIIEAGYATTDPGTGLGLRIVEQIAGAHGWDITVTEGEQGGARFEFTGVEFAEG